MSFPFFMTHFKILKSLLYRVCIKLPATFHQIDDSTRMEIFRIILNTHASLFSTLLVFASESIFEYGEIIINLVNGIRLTHWVPAQHDIALLQDWLLNECHTSVPSRLGRFSNPRFTIWLVLLLGNRKNAISSL